MNIKKFKTIPKDNSRPASENIVSKLLEGCDTISERSGDKSVMLADTIGQCEI